MFRRPFTSTLCVALILVNSLLPSIVGCDLDDVDLPPRTIARIQINTDPDDPMIGKLTGVENGDSLIFYGAKDANGLVAAIESMQYFQPGATAPFSFQFDGETRPIFITGQNGEVAALVYEGENVSVTLKDADGNVSVESFPLDEDARGKSKRASDEAIARLRETSKRVSAAQLKTTVQTIQGAVAIGLQSGGQNAGTVRDANINVTATAGEGIIPVGFNSATSRYEFTVAHRVADLQVLIAECQQVTGDTSAAFTAAGFVIAALWAVCITATSGFCAFMTGFGGGIVGLGVAGAGGTATAANYACDDLIISKAVESGRGRQNVNIAISHPTLKFNQNTTVTYDLFNPADPITAAKAFTASFVVQVEAAITNVRTSPAAPSGGQSYSVIFDFVPPTASIQYTVTGDDGFSRPETLAGDGTNTTVTGTPIPGGAIGVTDTIVADILLNGAKVGSSTPISLTFR